MRLPGSHDNPRWDAWRIAEPNAEPIGVWFSLWLRPYLKDLPRDIPDAVVVGLGHPLPFIIDHDAFDEYLFRNVAPYWAA